MWYWNPVGCNEALPGIHDLVDCIRIGDDEHPFKTQSLPEGKIWVNDENNQPVLQDIPAPTPDDLVAEAEAQKGQLKATADSEIAWRQDAVDAGIATAEENAALAEWKKYRVLLMRVDTSAAPDTEWPTQPEVQAS
ncbi:tail fiber assembly protein [Enterobacter hormaechei]|uniref:tail fiber assembly protein n=1 Tax=Enterobacter hormaechei TaxID=158836 RepID=UPI00201385F6|nr:tail fiber assembly protein [Enterobacter hormaechei]